MVDAVAMTANISSNGFYTRAVDNIGLEYTFTGTAATGSWTFFGSNDSADGTASSGNWFTVTPTGTAPTNPAGSAGATFGVNFNQYPYDWLRVGYTFTSGTGTLTVIAVGKEI